MTEQTNLEDELKKLEKEFDPKDDLELITETEYILGCQQMLGSIQNEINKYQGIINQYKQQMQQVQVSVQNIQLYKADNVLDFYRNKKDYSLSYIPRRKKSPIGFRDDSNE